MTELKAAGIDYIRLTSNENSAKVRFAEAWLEIEKAERADGYKPIVGGLMGFYGHKTRHAVYGTREEWQMLQVSGYQCKSAEIALRRAPGKATRIDLQITLKIDGDVSEKIKEAHDSSIACKSPNGKKWKTGARLEDGKYQTVYIGKRQSEWYGRIYDKYAESGKEEYRSCIRYEVEIKGKSAEQIWKWIYSGEAGLDGQQRVVIEWFAKHGIVLPYEAHLTGVLPKVEKKQVKEDSSIAWLAKQVSGTVQRLCSTGHWYPAFEAIFSKALHPVDRSAILFAMALIEVG